MPQGFLDGDARRVRPGCVPRKGPPLPVRTMRSTASGGLPCMRLKDGAVFAIDGQQSSAAPGGEVGDEAPARTSVSLLATATVLPASSAAQVPASPAAPTMALTTMSTSGCRNHLGDAVGAVQQTATGRQSAGVEMLRGVGVGERHPARPMALGLFQQGVADSNGAEAENLESFAEMGHDIEAVGADRAGGAEHDKTAGEGRQDWTDIRGHEAPE